MTRALRAAGAWLIIVALVFGVPALLITQIGWPLPHRVPTAHSLGQPPTGRFALDVLGVAGWAAWVWLTALLVTAARHVAAARTDSTSTVRFAPRGMQRVAVQLVAAAALVAGPGAVTATTATAAPLSAATVPLATPTPPKDLAVLQAAPTAPPAPPALPAASTVAGVPAGAKYVVVEEGDTLWGLAQAHLGDGLAYSQLWELNANRTMTTGEEFTDPSLVRPGWVLIVPDTAAGAGVAVAQPAPAPTAAPIPSAPPPPSGTALGSAQPSAPPPPPASTHTTTEAPSSVPSRAPAPTDPARSSSAPASAAVPSAERGTAPPATAARRSPGSILPLAELAGAGVLCAGLVTFLAKLARIQQGRRRRGRSTPRPTADQARMELAARIAADHDAADLVHDGLRYLATQLDTDDIPVIVGVEVQPGLMTILLDQPAPPPSGFQAGADGVSWHLSAGALDTAALDDVVPPLPALVTLGTDAETTVMVNLEVVRFVSLVGDLHAARETVAAAAVELATAAWSHQSRILLVGFGHPDGLGRPEPVELVEDLDACLENLRHTAAANTQLAADAHASGISTMRLGPDPSDLQPTIVICLNPPPDDAVAELAAMAADPASGLVAVVTAAAPTLPQGWILDIDSDGTLDIGPLARRVTAQRIPLPLLDTIEDRIATASAPDDTDPTVPAEDWWAPTEENDPERADNAGDDAGEDDKDAEEAEEAEEAGDSSEAVPAASVAATGELSDPPEEAGPMESPAANPHESHHTDPVTIQTPAVRLLTERHRPLVEDVPPEGWRDPNVAPEILVRVLARTPAVTRLGDHPDPAITVGRQRSLELLVYLAAHEEGVSRTRLAEAIHPELAAAGRTHNTNTFSTELTTARTSLGRAADGEDHMPPKTDGRYRLRPTVILDATVVERLMAAAENTTTNTDRIRLLTAAFSFIGDAAPLADLGIDAKVGRRNGQQQAGQHWRWWDIEFAAEVEERLVDVTGGLSELLLVAGEHRAAAHVARRGLAISPLSKDLWATLLNVEAECGAAHLQRARDEMERAFAEAEPYDTMDSELRDLSAQLVSRLSS